MGQTSQFTVVTKEGNLNLMRTKVGARKGQDQSNALTTVEQYIRQQRAHLLSLKDEGIFGQTQ